MLFGIISYHRAEKQKTLDFLTGNGVRKEDIILALNDEADIEPYTARYAERAKIIFGKKNNAAGNRNNILDAVKPGTRIVLMDDDVKGISKWRNTGKKYGEMQACSFGDFERVVEKGFSLCEAYGSNIFGFYPTENSMFISQTLQADGEYSIDRLFQGGCVGMIVSEERFDERVPVCDDYEYIVRQISRRRGVIRINTHAAIKEKDFSTKGGCYEAYQNGAQKKALMMIARKYPHIVTVKKDYTGLRVRNR